MIGIQFGTKHLWQRGFSFVQMKGYIILQGEKGTSRENTMTKFEKNNLGEIYLKKNLEFSPSFGEGNLLTCFLT